MNWIKAKDLEWWAETQERDCQAMLPYLISRLIRATSKAEDIKAIQFPWGDMVRLPGWDGVLDLASANMFLPEGISLFEIGTGEDVEYTYGYDLRESKEIEKTVVIQDSREELISLPFVGDQTEERFWVKLRRALGVAEATLIRTPKDE